MNDSTFAFITLHQGSPNFLDYWPNNLGLKPSKGPNSEKLKFFNFNHFLNIYEYCNLIKILEVGTTPFLLCNLLTINRASIILLFN